MEFDDITQELSRVNNIATEHVFKTAGERFARLNVGTIVKDTHIHQCGSIYIEMCANGQGHAEENPDICIAIDDVPRLILALQWIIAGPLGRRAVLAEACPLTDITTV